MNILYYDCFAGISGDMNLAAMINLGVDPAFIQSELTKLGLNNEFELKISQDSRHGIHGTRVDVVLKNQHTSCTHTHTHEEHAHAHNHESHTHEHSHEHSHEHTVSAHVHTHSHASHDHHHEHATHTHEHTHDHHHTHTHSHDGLRNLDDITAIIQRSELSDAVKATSLKMFQKVAEAEAHVHGKSIREVHFHEVGATDSIVDIVGAAICYHHLGVDEVWARPVELGGGFIRCAHGLIPVPAPATVEILHGLPTTRGAVQQETTTPTGATILASLVDHFSANPTMTIEKTAYGIGHRESEIPNLLRVHLARVERKTSAETIQQAKLLQCNIDDMTAEMLGVTMDILMDSGAMDVHFTPILMKKNRPATCISLLCSEEDEERFKELLFRHTTTLGIKSIPLDKTVLEVSFSKLETTLGTVTMKHAMKDGKIIRSKPELEDCKQLALHHGVPLSDVYVHINNADNNLKS